MHRDEVKIFRGNVQTHLQRLEQATQVTGAPPAAQVAAGDTSAERDDALEYESREDHASPWSYAINPKAFACLAATAAFLFVLELSRGWSGMSPSRLKMFGGGAIVFLVAMLFAGLWGTSQRR